MIFLGIFELGSLLCALANTSKMLIVARAIAGLGSSGLINGALTIIANCIPLEKRAGKAISYKLCEPMLTNHSLHRVFDVL
jgi:MFS family permease